MYTISAYLCFLSWKQGKPVAPMIALAGLKKKHFEGEDAQFPLTGAKLLEGPSAQGFPPIITPQFCHTHNFTILRYKK